MSFDVKQYKIGPKGIVRWLVIGKEREYVVTSTSCSCRGMSINLGKRQEKNCKHISLLEVAKLTGNYNSFTISAQEYHELRPYLLGLKK